MSNQTRALITGITGQDGSYLAELLLNKGYEVHGVVRRTSTSNTSRLDHILNLITIHQSDLTDQASLTRLIDDVCPHEVYNLAAQSFVHASFDHPVATADVTALGVIRMLEAIRHVNKEIKFYQASSSEMFGKVQASPQNEKTPFYPRSPYGYSKLFGHWAAVNYRESYDMFCCSGILFNHESPRRGIEFVTRKITNAVAKIKHGKQDKLFLGNLAAKRDWGFAGDYVNAMWLMMQKDDPGDYVIATGIEQSVQDFVEAAFGFVDLKWQDYVEVDPKFFRPAEVTTLCGDPTKALNELNWKPEVNLTQLVHMMVENDMELVQNEG